MYNTLLYVKEQKRLLCVRRRLLSKSEYPFSVAHQQFIVERKEGKQASCQRDRKGECVLPENEVGVRCKRPLGKGLP